MGQRTPPGGAEGYGRNTGGLPRIKYEKEEKKNISTKEESQRLAEKAKEVEMTQSTATVYLAAPTGKKLSIVGQSLKGWEIPQGSFTLVQEIEPGFGIFKGVVPIPLQPSSAFKFVQLESYDNLKYEGDNNRDNRYDELLPDAMYFFIFKESKVGWLQQGGKYIARVLGIANKTETKQKILTGFLNIAFNHALEQISSDWDAAIDVINDCLEKLERLNCTELPGCIQKLVSDSLHPVNFEHLFLLIVCAHKFIKNNFPKSLKEFLEVHALPFSSYLYQFKNPRRNGNLILQVLESLGVHGGPDFCWIPFCFNFQNNDTIRDCPRAVGEALIKTMSVMPEALLSKESVASRVTIFLLRSSEVDDVYDRLLRVVCGQTEYKTLIDRLLLKAVLERAKTIDDSTQVLRSRFLERVTDGPQTDEEHLKEFFGHLFNRTPSEIIKLASFSREWPSSVLYFVRPIVESMILKKMQLQTQHFNHDDYRYFALELDSTVLANFPEALRKIDEICMRMSNEFVRLGSFQSVPSLKLILRSLAQMDHPVPFLERPSFVDLQKAVNTLPRKFLQNLDSVLKNPALKDKNLRIHKKGETKDMAGRVERHSDIIEEILEKIRKRNIPLVEITRLQDPQVTDYLKYLGVEERILIDIQRQVEELKMRHQLYGDLYIHLARLNSVTVKADEDEGEDNDDPFEPLKVLDPEEWETYLNKVNLHQSNQSLLSAVSLHTPVSFAEANWLNQVKDCPLFMATVWYPAVKEVPRQNTPFVRDHLSLFVTSCAARWLEMARHVADGSIPFVEMEKVLRLEPDGRSLLGAHFEQGRPLHHVLDSYRDFKILKKLRLSIGPFIAALRFFNISQRETINTLYDTINNELIQNWGETTLARVRATGILQTLKEVLNIDPERPETMNPMKFIGSLVTEPDGSSPLIDWLRTKTDQQVEAMGKILQGSLFEAYGQLQTLKTRIAPFLQNEFNTYKDLLVVVRESEEKFAQRVAGRVQPIRYKWVASKLPEIEAAVRASVISPSEAAKEKLSKLSRVVIDVKGEDGYVIESQLMEPHGSLSVEELKEAFQLLDMLTLDENLVADDGVAQTIRNVGLILRLADVFAALSAASSCISYAFQSKRVIQLEDLEQEIQDMKKQLNVWNKLWNEVEKLPHLAMFSRSYLLHVAELLRLQESEQVISILRILLPSASEKLESTMNRLVQLVRGRSQIGEDGWLSTDQLLYIFQVLHELIQLVYYDKGAALDLPTFLTSFGHSLRSHFIDKSIEILNVPRDLLAGSALAAYMAVTRRRIEPGRILFVTANTNQEEVKRFMSLWSLPGHSPDELFIIVHVERLSALAAGVVREAVGMVLPEKRTKLLLLAQQHHRVQSTKSLGARLGLVSDRLLDVNFTADQLRECFSKFLPKAANMHFFTSKLPGCGKSQQAMRQAASLEPRPNYYRIPIRLGTVEEVLGSAVKVENLLPSTESQGAFLHFDVAHSTSFEFNDLLLSLLIHGALYDPRRAKLGFWSVSNQTTIAIEFSSPSGSQEFPVIGYLGQHFVSECSEGQFTYDLAMMPQEPGQEIVLDRSNALIATGKFLQLKEAEMEGLTQWDAMCNDEGVILTDPLPEEETFRYLVGAFKMVDNKQLPTYSSLYAMANFLHRHICAMLNSVWFNKSASHLFEDNVQLAQLFKLDVFELLLRVANDCVSRCWSITNKGQKLADMDWTERQRAMLLLGLEEGGSAVSGMNIVGRKRAALRDMFRRHPSLLPILQAQCLQFHELDGFNNLLQTQDGGKVIINAMRSLLLLDGTATSAQKVSKLDSHPRNTPAIDLLNDLMQTDLGYVLTGDNITKMMFALYRIRCGLPVIAFGEAGIGKSALFRFLIQSLLGHEFHVCNVNSGTTVSDVTAMVEEAFKKLAKKPEEDELKAHVFLFFDEMNTADPPVIAFLKELMLDRHCNGTMLPENLHIMAAANPYRFLKEADEEATVGLSFRFAQNSKNDLNSSLSDARNLVYRVNELPLAFYDHVYDFGHLCDEAERTYIEEISKHYLRDVMGDDSIARFVTDIHMSHRVARAMSRDPDSAVSLRDATRASQLFHWFCESPAGKTLTRNNRKIGRDLTVYLVYAFRFLKRKTFLKNVFGANQTASGNMTEVSRNIAKMLYEHAQGASIGSGAIALNDALCENLFALFVCVLNGIFLIIVGRPGSSKSLSVEILKLVLSPGNHTLRQQLGDLPALTERYFQCSPLSTSSGFKALFESAQKLSDDPKTMLAMVVLDELGLADLSPEKPIKVLHSELERKATLTSGEQQQSTYSVVALSNWVVDAAQVNRGILICRTQAGKMDLINSATQLAESLIRKYVGENAHLTRRFKVMLQTNLECIAETYSVLDSNTDVGGGHFFSMRDFFFCVKNFVCSILGTSENGQLDIHNLRITNDRLIQSAIRNFGGHSQAQRVVREIMAEKLEIRVNAIPMSSPLGLIVQNIKDSSQELSVHIARHLMILNRSMIALQLLNRHVKNQLGGNLGWHVLFGSCFPGDLQVMAVTRKLRQVEQAIRAGGVLILCHADQLFESLYMVLNQQYWAQGDVTMTQIALGPSTRSIALPDGPFRIIALQDTDTALNSHLMSPAVLSRFEKHELRPSYLLKATGRFWLNKIETHPVWTAVSDVVKRKKLLYGYHEESFAALALQLQETKIPLTEEKNVVHDILHVHWMRAINPMTMIKLEREANHNWELLEVCRSYRKDYVLEGIDDALTTIEPSSKRMVIMTNTLRHLEVSPREVPSFVIRLFEIQTELELHSLLDSIKEEDLSNPNFVLLVQYDATTGPIEQFQMTKYEIDARMAGADCRIAFIVHVDPRPIGMQWVYSFGDGWDYLFVDEIVSVDQARSSAGHQRVSLKELVYSPVHRTMSDFIRLMNEETFKHLLLEMLGPSLQTSLSQLQSSLGHFYSGVRGALVLPDNHRLILVLKECLSAQLDDSSVTWDAVEAVRDADFDSSSSLTEGLWGTYKHKISIHLAHLLLTSDVWRVSNTTTMQLWCDFVEANYSDRLMLLHSNNMMVPKPDGFDFCSQPFGRLLASFVSASVNQEPNLNGPLHWLLNHIMESDQTEFDLNKAYFSDWLKFRIPLHLRPCLDRLPFDKMRDVVDDLFNDQENFFEDWNLNEAQVMAALELVKITFAATGVYPWNTGTGRIRSWEVFAESAARSSLIALAEPNSRHNQNNWIQSISSIEISPALCSLVDRVEDISQLWLGLRITKRMLLFDPHCTVALPDELGSSVEQLILSLTELVIESVIRPRLSASGNENRRAISRADLSALLDHASTCNSPEALARKLRTCPTTNALVPFGDDRIPQEDERCSSCHHLLVTLDEEEDQDDEEDEDVDDEEEGDEEEEEIIHHLIEPDLLAVESLFQDHLKFLFFFERVVELFVHHRRNEPQDIRNFISHLLAGNSRLRVSWRFLTVIMKSVLSTRPGSVTVDSLLATIRCNAPSKELNSNALNFLRALLVRADEDVKSDEDDRRLPLSGDWKRAVMIDQWTMERIRRLALIRKSLASENIEAAVDALTEWGRLRRNEHDPATTEAFLLFVLNFASAGGDETRLNAIFSQLGVMEEIIRHPIVGPYIRVLSPLSLGFNLLPAGMKSQHFEDQLTNDLPFDGVFQHYGVLQEIEPTLAPFIARLAFHAADVVENKQIGLLRELDNNLDFAAQCYLPGIGIPFLTNFKEDLDWDGGLRWYVCSCATLNFIDHCGRLTIASVCTNCKVVLAVSYNKPRPGVRRATIEDFKPPKGIATYRTPSDAPALSIRGKSAAVTRLCLLLNSLVLMNAAMDPRSSDEAIFQLLQTLEATDRPNHQHPNGEEDRRVLIRFLSDHIQVHLRLLSQLLVIELNQPDQFRVGHFLLHRLLMKFDHAALKIDAQQFAAAPQTREAFENCLVEFLAQQGRDLEQELDRVSQLSNEAALVFRRALANNQASHWTYTCLISSNRLSVQLLMARDEQLRRRYPFLDLLLNENESIKLDALLHLGDAVRFVTLVRTVLQGNITLNGAMQMTIGQGLEKMTEMVEQKSVLLDRGRAVSTREQVYHLFQGFKMLWDRFSQIPNVGRQTFLDYIRCQGIAMNVRPKPIMDENDSLLQVLAVTDPSLPEMTFACQLLKHAVEAAASIAKLPFVQPGCRTVSGVVKFSNASSLADFDDSFFAHFSALDLDRFLSDHVIDKDTLELAESFAMAAVLGPAGSTIAQDLSLEIVQEFCFKDRIESDHHFLSLLENRSLAWQPAVVPPEAQERILVDLEKNRCLAEAKAVLVSAITHLQTNTEPLFIAKMRNTFISDILEGMQRAGILTEQHLSATTMTALNRYIKLEVRHAFSLLKGVISRMKGDDLFGGRIPAGWDTPLDNPTERITREKLRSLDNDVIESLLGLANNISSTEDVPQWLLPDKSLLFAIRQTEGEDWDGIPPELKMEHLGHVLLIAESLINE